MRAAGIICEYNPIHNGHVRQIEYARTNGADVIVCVMSGSFTQRGEFAIADKYTRAKAAIKAGADVVFELPFPFSSMSAEFFARAGVYILSRLGVDTICFGHECDDIDILYKAATVLSNREFIEKLEIGNTKGFFDTLSANLGYTLCSNDILGAYYIAAKNTICPEMNILPIHRDGAAYTESTLSAGVLPSANAIRNSTNGSFKNIPDGNIPQSAMEVLISAENDGIAPVYSENASREILSFFRLLSSFDIKKRAISISGGDGVLDDGCGIVERLISAAYETDSYGAMLEKSYNSKFTNARINRLSLFSVLGVSNAMKNEYPEYTTLLASSKCGREFLSSIRKSAQIPIVTKPADAPKDSKQYKISSLADTLYCSAIGKNVSPSYFKYLSPYIEN